MIFIAVVSTMERQRSDDGSSSEQRTSDSAVQSHNPIKITDVNQLCLEKIFIFLNLEDLVNVACANKHLQLATYAPYARKIAKKTTKINLFEDSRSGIIDKEDTVVIENFKTILQMLRCFGHIVTNINVWVATSELHHIYHRVCSYITEYCAKTLQAIEMNEARGLQAFNKPFPKIESFQLSDSLPENCNLSEIFPNLRRLICVSYCDPGSITPVHFSKLDHLSFLLIDSSATERAKQIIYDILRLNRQLRSFGISITNFDDLQFYAEYLGSIESLHIDIQYGFQSKHLIRVQNVRSLTVKFWDVKNIHFPLLINQLMELTVGGDFEWNKSFYEFIKEHKFLEKITFECENLLSSEDSLEIAKELPSVQTITVLPLNFRQIPSIDTITSYLSIFRSLKCLHFNSLYNSMSENGMRSRYGQEWHIACTRHNQIYTFKRIEPLTK